MGTHLQVRPLEAAEFDRWNKFVANSPQGTLFHTTPWLEATGSRFHVYGCFRGEELRGGLAIGLAGTDGATHPPLTPYLGVVLPPPDGKYVATLTAEKEISLALARQVKVDFLSFACRLPPEATDLQPFLWEDYSTSVRYTYRLDVMDLDRVWNNMEATRRNDIRRAEKDGLTIEAGLLFPRVYALIEKSFERQGQGVSFGETARRLNARMESAATCRSFLARDSSGRDLGAVYLVWDARRAYYLLGGYQHQGSHHGACALAMWQAIRYTRETLGLAEFDFEGSTIPDIERFFRKFGGVLTPTYFIAWEHPSRRDWFSRWQRRLKGSLQYRLQKLSRKKKST